MRFQSMFQGLVVALSLSSLTSSPAVARDHHHGRAIHGYGCNVFGPCRGYYDDQGNRWEGPHAWERAVSGDIASSVGHR